MSFHIGSAYGECHSALTPNEESSFRVNSMHLFVDRKILFIYFTNCILLFIMYFMSPSLLHTEKLNEKLNVEFNTKLKFKNAEHSRVGVKNLIKIPLWLRKRRTEFSFLLLKLLYA